MYLFFFLVADILFSNFIYKKEVKHDCYEVLDDFYSLKKNCYAKEKWVKEVESYSVYTNDYGFRFSGKENKEANYTQTAAFLGGSFTYGTGLNYERSFVGILEKNLNDYNVYNLGVPGYSPTVFNYQLKQLIEKKILPNKIFVVLDISDVFEEARKWDKNINGKHPIRIKKKDENMQDIQVEKPGSLKNFKEKNFKGIRLISRGVNNFFRSIRFYFDKFKSKSKTVEDSYYGSFLYTSIENTDPKLWIPFGFDKSISKIEKNFEEISVLADSINADLYIIIYPWPDSLEYGQAIFNWEEFAENLCDKTSCSKLINFFPDFRRIKKASHNWLNEIYIEGGLHMTENIQKIVATKILKEAFLIN